ncbi:MAG TPA: ribonuclease III, partial [Herpetosiphonaceae bacterium]
MHLSRLWEQLSYRFESLALLEAALVHRSYVHEHPDCIHPPNERLEFLGDALLNFITGSFLYESYPERGEGELTQLRAALVKTRTLASFARQYDLGAFLMLSRGEERAGARTRDSLLADAFEALIAAISLDGGWQAARDFVLPHLRAEVVRIEDGVAQADWKSLIQQRVQAMVGITPDYRKVSVAGPDHRREWTMEVWAGEVFLGRGKGRSKQLATQQAAELALAALDGDDPPKLVA